MLKYLDEIDQGASYAADFNTGEFDSTGKTPRFVLVKASDNSKVADFRFAQIDAYNYKIGFLPVTTAALSSSESYYSCLDFVAPDGNVYRIARGTYKINPGPSL